MSTSPFINMVQTPLVAIRGYRCGYIQLACSVLKTTYSEQPLELFEAARQWAITLETLGAKRVYWITLSEAVSHLHIHLYPRWEDSEMTRGIALFENRAVLPQPVWTPHVEDALSSWAKTHEVGIVSWSKA